MLSLPRLIVLVPWKNTSIKLELQLLILLLILVLPSVENLKVKSALKAIKTPTGFPTTVALLQIFVANTIIIINGMGLTRNLAVKCNAVAAIKSMDVTRSLGRKTLQNSLFIYSNFIRIVVVIF